MNENNEKKQVATIWFLTVLVVILIAIIVGLIITVGKVKKEKIANQNGSAMQTIQEFENTVSKNDMISNDYIERHEDAANNIELDANKPTQQVKNDAISNQITETEENDNRTTTSSTVTTIDEPKTNPKINIIGDWEVSKIADKDGKEIPLNQVFGTGISYSNKLSFNDDMTYINGIGITGEGNEAGTYIVDGNKVTLTDKKGRVTTLTINDENNTMSEKNDNYIDGYCVITYTRISDEQN